MLKQLVAGKRLRRRFITTFLTYHQPGDKRDILILSSPRSGSTWLMELLYTQPRMKYVDEPLAKNVLDSLNILPIRTRWAYVNLGVGEQHIIKRYFKSDRQIKYFGPWDIFDENYNFFTNRRVIKVIRANALIEWFSDELDMDIVYLLRHPIAQSLSCIQRGHHCRIIDYLRDDQFIKAHVNEKQVRLIRQVLESGTDLEKFVTEWCLDNLVPLKFRKKHDVLILTYEELVLRPEAVVELLCDRLNLVDRGRMLERISTPSKVTDSSTEQTKVAIEAGERRFLIEKWRENTSEFEERRAFEILQQFDIQAYRFGSCLPNDSVLNFHE